MGFIPGVIAALLLSTLALEAAGNDHGHVPSLRGNQPSNDLPFEEASRSVFDPSKDVSKVYYKAAALPPDMCSSRSIEHTNVVPSSDAPGSFYVPHTKIIASGQRCGTGLQSEYMWVIPGRFLTDPVAAYNTNVSSAFKALQIYPRVRTTFSSLSKIDAVYVGFELSSDRVCNGTVHWTQGSMFIFIGANNKEIDFHSYGFVYVGEDAMLGYKAMDPIPSVCVYKTSLKSAPKQTPLPSPSGSPPPAPSSSPNAFESLPTLSGSEAIQSRVNF
jgi:hypothetical protein